MTTEARGLCTARQFRLAVGQGQQKKLAGHKRIAAFERLFFSGLQQFDQIGADLYLVLPSHLRQPFNSGSGGRQQAVDVDTRSLQQGFGAVLLLQHGQQNVCGVDVGVVFAQSQTLSVAQGFLELSG